MRYWDVSLLRALPQPSTGNMVQASHFLLFLVTTLDDDNQNILKSMMRCPRCGLPVETGYRFCSKCGCALPETEEVSRRYDAAGIDADKEKSAIPSLEKNVPDFLKVIKNKGVWEIAPAEIARHITEKDFETLADLSGIIVPDGTTAVIFIDGREVASLSGGVYDFVKDEDVKEVLDRHVVDCNSLRGMAVGLWRSVLKFVTGRRVGKSEEMDDRARTVPEVISYLNKDSRIGVYLKVDGAFPAYFGIDPDERDGADFKPIVVRTRVADIQVAVTLHLKITDFKEFIREYLVRKSFVTTHDIQKALAPYIKKTVQSCLADEEVSEIGVSQALSETIARKIEGLSRYLYGLEIVRVDEVTCDNRDLKRYHDLAKELYCNERELEFLHKTNELKNRLAVEINAQEVANARSKEELSKALHEVDKDHLLNEEEMSRFKRSLALDSENYALGIEASRLDNMVRFRKRKMDIETAISKAKIEQESQIEQAGFDAIKARAGRQGEMMDIDLMLYGKAYVIQRSNLEHSLELDDITRHHGYDVSLEDADVANKLLKKNLEGHSMTDDYEVGRFRKRMAADNEQKRSEMDFLRQKQEMSMSAMERLNAMKERNADGEHARRMDEAMLVHKERMAAMSAEENMSAEKLFVKNLKDMGGDAASAYAASFSTRYQAEAATREAELRKEQAEDKSLMYERMLEQQRHGAENLMGFAERAMRTNASLIKDDSERRGESERHRMDSMERIATQRISEVSDMKEEYREQMRLQQERTDINQNIALEYATKVREPRRLVSPAGDNVECPSCGAMVDKAKFCGNCGAELE